jgi:WXG100 family type VII secretion target
MGSFGNINIQPAELRAIAQQIASQRSNLDGYFQSIQQQMMSLENEGWDSESGRALRGRFASLRSFYDQKYPPAMESYIQFLNNTADTYEQAERNRMQEVEALTNMGQR